MFTLHVTAYRHSLIWRNHSANAVRENLPLEPGLHVFMLTCVHAYMHVCVHVRDDCVSIRLLAILGVFLPHQLRANAAAPARRFLALPAKPCCASYFTLSAKYIERSLWH